MSTPRLTPSPDVSGPVIGSAGVPGRTSDEPGLHLDIHKIHQVGDRLRGPVTTFYSVTTLDGRVFAINADLVGHPHWKQGV